MVKHTYLWDRALNGHRCRDCGAQRPTATPEQYAARMNALDVWRDAVGDGHASETVTSEGAPVFEISAGTGQGYALRRVILDDKGETIAELFLVNMRSVDSVPASFRKFHAANNNRADAAMREYARHSWTVNMAESQHAPECA